MEPDEHLTAAAPVTPALPGDGEDSSTAPERRCILTGVHGERDVLIRLALGPDGQVGADLGAKLPGRGAWVVADRAVLEKSLGPKGKLKGALARAFKTSAVGVADDLPERIAAGLERRALDLLGLENKAGNLIWGHERIGEALLKGRVKLLLHAADAAADGTSKLEARRRGASPDTASLVLPVGRDALSMALGRENVVHAAIVNAASAARLMAAIGRWRAFAGLNNENNQADADGSVADTAHERH